MRDFVLANLSQTLYSQPHAILPEKLRELVAVFEARRSGAVRASDDGGDDARLAIRKERADMIGAKLRDVAGMTVDQVGKVAVLPMQGTITQKPGVFSRYSGGTSAEQFAVAHEQLLADETVSAVIWDIDSPGGSVAGVPEAAARLLAMRGQKRTVAFSNTCMASAAYWLGSAADEIVSAPSAVTGSIGVVAVHEDYSRANAVAGVNVDYIHAGKYKVEGNPDQPLSGEARAAIQQTVDDYYAMFLKAVAKARGDTVANVQKGYGEARALTAERAKDAKLVDRIATLGDLLAKLGGGTRSRATAERMQRQAEAQ